MRAAVYARYSSDNQREASIEDQVRLCRERIARESWSVATTYTDAAISGASRLRPGYRKLLEDARAGEFDVVVAEALDRLSRDQEDVAGLYKQLGFCGIRLVTIAEGEISELHVGLKGTMNALYLKDLAQKTRRGLEGRVRAGRSGGGNAYGYDVVREVDAQGEPVRGGRRVNEAEAAIVRRIYSEFAAGTSPTAISRKLNAEKIPGPRGRPWGDSTIRGHALRRTGILHNGLYVGRLVWNKQRYVKDPVTSKRLARLNPESEWIVQELPELRIVDDELWNRVQARLGDIRESPRVAKARESRFWERRRARHLLTGLVKCGCCGSSLAAVGRDYLACPSARSRGTCDNRKGIRRDHLEALVLDGLKERLMQPDMVREFVAAFNEEINRGRRDQELAIEARRRELARIAAKLDGLTNAIADGLRTPGLLKTLEGLEAQKAELEWAIEAAPLPPPRIHPNVAELYRRKVMGLHAALSADDTRAEAAEILRGLIEAILIRPAERGTEIELVGDIVNMLKLPTKGSSSLDAHESSVKVVAGACNRLNLLLVVQGLPLAQKRWQRRRN